MKNPVTSVAGFLLKEDIGCMCCSNYTIPWLIIALATFMKPATLAPFT
jgi:hypothetical protein